jgi:arsenite/tail-anchored protein-transporting ATPase
MWDAFRGEYRAGAEQLLAGLVGGASADADRGVTERLLDLAPPGIDELMALVQVVDLTGDRRYDALILDTAPTGHLLRMLELPGVALEWTRALLRMLLKYREVTGLGGMAERVLHLSRDLRRLRELLQDPRECWFLGVALPEALSVPETRRLLARLRRLGITPGALLVNRALGADGGLLAADRVGALVAPDDDDAMVFAAAPDRAAGPVGPEALAAFAEGWRELVPMRRR